MSQRVIFVCGDPRGKLSVALLAALIKSRSSDEMETLLVRLDEPIPPPTYLLSAPTRDANDDELVIVREDHSGHSLRSQRHDSSEKQHFKSLLMRSRRAQSMTRRCRHRN